MKAIARWVLAALMVVAGVAHFVALDSFLLLVLSWLPWPTAIVWVTGVMEIGLGAGLVFAPAGEWRRSVGRLLAVFLLIVYVGNISQAVSGVDAFGLDTDAERWGRLVFQPVLIAWALWSTGAWLGRHPRPPDPKDGILDLP
ncbi:MAG: DoxX family protein [Actinomycetota bacterium]